MRLLLHLDGSRLRNWDLHLVMRLKALPDMSVTVAFSDATGAHGDGFETLFRLESLLHGWPLTGPAASLPRSALLPFQSGDGNEPDIVLDLQGDAPATTARLWRLTCDGVMGETALLACLLARQTPEIAIVEDDRIIVCARPGSEHGGMLLASFEDCLHRIITLIVAALSGGAGAALPLLPDAKRGSVSTAPDAARLARLAAGKIAGLVARRLYELCCHAPHWRTGWRKLSGPDLYDLRGHPPSGWHDLPDDGYRFYADPVPILHEGKLTLFLEEFDHRVGKGIISAVGFGPDGPLGTPQPVLEQPGHLSYPFVFARDGEVWMIPESCTAGTIDLFRATAFPGGWVKEATLVSGIAASDATLIEHGGLWWMFATVRDGGGAYSDALHLWSAPGFRGPWTPHPRNPVLIDIASARPAGPMVVRDGALLRPVQDCRRGYGAAMAIARVTRLDREGYEQTVETALASGPLWPGRRMHTLSSAGGFEFIDGSGFSRRKIMGY